MIHENKTQKRRNRILEILKTDGNVHVVELSQCLGISAVTIRKDLEYMEKQGLLQRVWGGAVPKPSLSTDKNEDSFERKKNENRNLKLSLARAVADLIQDGDSLLIHSGSTSYYVVEELKKKKDLVVITNVFTVVAQLQDCDQITTFFLGGRVYRKDSLTVGESVISQLENYSVDKLIMGADGVDPVSGITTAYHHREDYIVHQMIQQAKETILVADKTKLGRKMLMRLADISEIDVVVTNRSEEKEPICKEIEERGIKVIRVD